MAVASATNINEALDGNVVLEVESLDRLYLNAYVRAMAVGGQVVRFLTDHLGNTIPHPASFTKIGNRFRQQVHAFAHTQGIPMLRLKKPDRRRWDDRKLDHVRPYLDEAESEGRFGVVATWFAHRATSLAHASGKSLAQSRRQATSSFEITSDSSLLEVIRDREFEISSRYDAIPIRLRVPSLTELRKRS